MESAHAEAAVLLIEAGADRTRVRASSLSPDRCSRGMAVTDKCRRYNSRERGRRWRGGTEQSEAVRHRSLWSSMKTVGFGNPKLCGCK